MALGLSQHATALRNQASYVEHMFGLILKTKLFGGLRVQELTQPNPPINGLSDSLPFIYPNWGVGPTYGNHHYQKI